MKSFLTLALSLITLFTAGPSLELPAQVERIEIPGNEDNRFFMPYSMGMKVHSGKLVFLSGANAAPAYHSHPHVHSEFADIPLDAGKQTETTLNTMRKVLQSAGGDLDNIVQMTIYAVDVENNGDAIQKVTAKYFGNHKPASAVVEVPAIITDPKIKLEITAIAVVPEGSNKEATTMKRTPLNPWTWNDQFAYNQGEIIEGGKRELVLAGQTSVDADGKPLHIGDIRGQTSVALDNIETVLKQAGMDLSNIVRVRIYTTDVDLFMKNFDVFVKRMEAAGAKPPQTLLGINRLALPELMVEIEVTARK